MTGRIYPIQDQASAKAQLLNQGVFDWPELQPQVTPTAPKPPVQPIAPASTVATPPVAPTTPPPTPPANSGHDYGKENNDLLQQILLIVKAILDKITGVFK